jgi:phosphate-selective porin OprO and OprP
MTRPITCSAIALAVAVGWTLPAQAAPAENAAVLQELAEMRAQMNQMSQRIESLESQLQRAQSEASQARAEASAAQAAAATNSEQLAAAKPKSEISWSGAPKITGPGGWSFKPRGRLQVDAGSINVPDSTGREGGFGSEVRRARLGVEGDIPGGFGYKFEVDFAGNEVEVADAILSYDHKDLKIAIGQQNTFQSLEELTSSRFSSFIERAAFTDAFNFERRVGVSAQYTAGDVLVQGGVFSDNLASLSNKSWSADGRVVFMPKLGDTQLHVGGSVHYAELNDAATTVRYRQRPLAHFTDERFINTGNIPATSETGYGLELAAINGPLHFAGEAFWQKVNRPGMSDPTFFGGYAEVGYFLTGGDTRGYKGGTFDRVKPSNGVDKGGFGAVQVNLRYDYLDLNYDNLVGVGGKQNGFAASLIWTPTSYTRFLANYARMQYSNAVHAAAGGDRSYGVDVFAVRAQIDF